MTEMLKCAEGADFHRRVQRPKPVAEQIEVMATLSHEGEGRGLFRRPVAANVGVCEVEVANRFHMDYIDQWSELTRGNDRCKLGRVGTITEY